MIKKKMTHKERLLAAMRNEMPDRVPVAPDTSVYIPIKRTGLPFWEVLFEGKIPLWQAYLDVADDLGTDAWVASVMSIPFTFSDVRAEWQSEMFFDESRDAMIKKTAIRTPDGDLTQEDICFRGDPSSWLVKPIKNLADDFKKFKWTQPMPTGVDDKALSILRNACHKRDYAFGVSVSYPGFHMWNCFIQDGIEALSYAETDTSDILQEWFEFDLDRGTRQMELALKSGIDYILFGGSGTITMASPSLAAKYAIPALKKWSKMAKDAGVPTMLHSCGKSRILADMLAGETDVGMLNPLEVPPMGDINLAEVKQTHGWRLAFMGNLHTIEVMLYGKPEDVRRESLKAMLNAGIGGGFILSTGDQCGRETPMENLQMMVKTAEEFGTYPLDIDAILEEINQLEGQCTNQSPKL